ncbi:hypothetical protein P8T80_08005 [Corynebacterium rouxii]|uniref:ATP-binding protein n=1 Tax=Corynebacterium rouxii TaxID=2719119 RepID=A0ABU3PNH8_9CORY|nr:AAA family ATPase [Corynebacterium rouxii]MDT9411321.1 hypothetical protein [Corynebacterium rouxii]
MGLHVVTGPPAAGKTTFVDAHRTDGDIVIDFDAIANAIAGKPSNNHEHTHQAVEVTKLMRQAAIDHALTNPDMTIWLIHTKPSRATLSVYRQRGAEIHVINPGKKTVMQRCKEQRPPYAMKIAADWYEATEKANTTRRGYGATHQKNRRRLLAQHIDGTPCEHCGKPMFKDPQRNFDHAPLEADHPEGKEQARMGTQAQKRTNHATRLLHRRCNRQLGVKVRNELNGHTQGNTAPDTGFQWA